MVLTLAVLAVAIACTPAGRFEVARLQDSAQSGLRHLVGMPPTREEIDASWRLRRERSVEKTTEILTRFYDNTTPQMRRMFDMAGMDPEHALVRWGRADPAFVISSKIFEIDDGRRSYRMRPNMRSVWLRQVTLIDGPFGMFQVPDTPEMRSVAAEAGAIVDEPSVQNTNSWGLRGPEPDPNAPLRGIILGDSFMQAMFLGDADTPAECLRKELEEAWKMPVSLVNTGHIGYSPEQYYACLEEYCDLFQPVFVVVSLCPNDFGEGSDVLEGKGDWWDEAGYWIGEIKRWCFGHNALCLFVAVPCDLQLLSLRQDAYYPGPIANVCNISAYRYCDPFDVFIDEHLRARNEATRAGEQVNGSPLFNSAIHDNHFSVLGAKVWAREVGRRLTLLLEHAGKDPSRSAFESHLDHEPRRLSTAGVSGIPNRSDETASEGIPP